MSYLSQIYGNHAVKSFGQAYRRALRNPRVQDYASLIDLENAETEDALAEALRRFLRRNHKVAMDESWFWPSEQQLEELMALASGKENVRLVRAAIESYALVWEPPQHGKEPGSTEEQP